jgi:hypothetical protein
MIGMWVPSMQPITPGNPKIYQIDWLVLQVSKLYDINELLLRLIPAILWNSSLRSLVGLWLGNTTNVHSSRFSASVTFRTARQTVALDTCSASPTLYKKLPLAKNEVQYKEFARNWERVHDVSCERCEGWEYCLYKWLMMQRNGNAQTGSYSSGNDKTSKYLRLDINWLFNKRTRHVCHCLQSAGFNLRAGETRG